MAGVYKSLWIYYNHVDDKKQWAISTNMFINEHMAIMCLLRRVHMEDRRVARTKRAIKKVFMEFLKEKPLNKISVAEISREADLGRGTFYLHYTDVFDLYNHMEDELYSDLIQIFDESYHDETTNSLMKLIETITKYIEDNKDIFLLLTGSDNEGKPPMRKLKEIFTKKLLQPEYTLNVSKYDEVESLFIVSGVTGILEDWVSAGLTIPQREIADILHKILIKL
jgi:AcrR family transcriptional regulator